MPRYRVFPTATASTVITVEAENKEAAIEAALDHDMPSICAQCSGWGSDQNLELSEWDVRDDDIELEDA